LKKMTLVFKDDDCRIFINSKPKNISLFDKVIEDPDLSRVIGISPSYWKLVDGKHVFPMTADERRAKNQKHHGTLRHFRTHHLHSKLLSAVLGFAMIIVGGLTMFYLIKKGIIK